MTKLANTISIHNFLKNISLIFDYREKYATFVSTNSATLPIEQRTKAELFFYTLWNTQILQFQYETGCRDTKDRQYW